MVNGCQSSCIAEGENRASKLRLSETIQQQHTNADFDTLLQSHCSVDRVAVAVAVADASLQLKDASFASDTFNSPDSSERDQIEDAILIDHLHSVGVLHHDLKPEYYFARCGRACTSDLLRPEDFSWTGGL